MTTAWFRGEGGSLHEFTLPLPAVFAYQVSTGLLIEVPDPSGAPDPDAPEPSDADPSLGSLERPARSDSKAEWLAYAVQVPSDLTAEQLGALSKAELVERFA